MPAPGSALPGTPSPPSPGSWRLRKVALDRTYADLTRERVEQWILEARIDPDDLVLPPGATEWVTAAQAPGLSRLFSPAALGTERLDMGTFGASFQRSRRARTGDTEVDITPFIDCTFLLLIFFVVTAQFSNQAMKVEPPSAKNTSSHKQEKLVVVIDRAGHVFLGAREVLPDRLAGEIRDEMLRTQQQSVVIRADRGSLHGLFVKVLDQCKEAGARQVFVGAVKEED